MSFLKLPKGYHPDFVNPRVLPAGKVKVDWSHPLAKDLLFCAVDGVDLVSGHVAKLISSNSGFAKTRLGPALESNSTSNGGHYYEASSRVAELDGSLEVTQAVIGDIDSTGTFSGIMSVPYFDDSWASPYVSVALTSFNTATRLRSLFTTGSGDRVNLDTLPEGSYPNDGQRHMWAHVKNATTTMNVYKDGEFLGNNTQANYANGLDSPQSVVVFLSRNQTGAAEGVDGRIYTGCLWKRALTANELRSFNESPYQFLKPANDPLLFIPGGAAPAFKPYWAHQANTLIQGGM